MKKSLIYFIATIFLLSFIQAEAFNTTKQKSFNKIFNAQKINKLNIQNEFGDIDIKTWNDDKVSVNAKMIVRARNEKSAEDLLNEIDIDVEELKDILEIRTNIKRKRITNIAFEILLEIKMPKNIDISINNNFGDVKVSGGHSSLSVNNENGDINLQNIKRAVIKNSFGKVNVSQVQKGLIVNNSDGSITIDNVKGPVKVIAKFSDMWISNLTDSLYITSNDGDIELNNIRDTRVDNSFGNIKASKIDGNLSLNIRDGKIVANNILGAADIYNTFGNVELTDVAGSIEIDAKDSDVNASNIGKAAKISNQFGDVKMVNIQGDLKIKSADSDIFVKDVYGNLTVENRFGKVQGQGIQGNVNINNSDGGIVLSVIEGKTELRSSFSSIILDDLNPQLSIKNSDGDITISKLRPGIPNIDIKASFSDINLSLNKNISASLYLATTFGSITTNDIDGFTSRSMDKVSFNGNVGGGKGIINCTGTDTDILLNIY